MPPVSPAAADTARLGYRDNAGEEAVAGILDDASVMPGNDRFHHGGEQ